MLSCHSGPWLRVHLRATRSGCHGENEDVWSPADCPAQADVLFAADPASRRGTRAVLPARPRAIPLGGLTGSTPPLGGWGTPPKKRAGLAPPREGLSGGGPPGGK